MLPSWLEIVEGHAPILLIAPHGGRAGTATRAMLHPKVNDLGTAAITRELASRLRARALINTAMDRNELDCNRLSQLSQHAPWLLELITEQLIAIIKSEGHATVLVIHGWNIIEPRVDLGLGLKEIGGTLRPLPGAYITAREAFIRGQVSVLAARLRHAQIHPTFGLRYPGAAAHNLLQGFTPRHASSKSTPLRQLATIAADGGVDALQLEMSVTLRLPGELRERAIDAITQTFATRRESEAQRSAPAPICILTQTQPTSPKMVTPKAPPSRVGVEFYDPTAGIGGMVSFDFGPGAAGGRIMILFGGSRVALFTAEGEAERKGHQLSIGPLILNASHNGNLVFRGPAVIVDDGRAYLSVEDALARSRIDQTAAVQATLEFEDTTTSFSNLLIELDDLLAAARTARNSNESSPIIPPRAAFGRLRGFVQLGGRRSSLDAAFRLGASFTGLGLQKFVKRWMLWSNFRRPTGHEAFEARELQLDGGACHRLARVSRNGHWSTCKLTEIRAHHLSPNGPPERVAADATDPAGVRLTIEGTSGAFVMLSRPGPDQTRLHTTLGFAEFRLGDLRGAGMYEFSQRVGLNGDPEAF
jgi:hypothetical protein